MEFVPYLEIDDEGYTDVVPRYYKMNSVTEDLIYGDEIAEGMKVLVGEWRARYDESEPTLHNAGLLTHNRWCTVTKLRIIDRMVYFIGEYADGQKVRRDSNSMTTWIVKKSSVPTREEPADHHPNRCPGDCAQHDVPSLYRIPR
jgi:hypothetical protein